MERHTDSGTAGSGRPTLSRRQVLAGIGAATAGGLAGCEDAGDDIVDSPETFGHVFPYDPESVHLNPWPTASYPFEFYTMLFEAKSVQVPGEPRQLTDLVESVAIDGTTATVTFDDSFTWWNGDPVTAGDQLVWERIQAEVSDEDQPAVDQLDEHTLAYEFDAELSRPLVLSRVAGDTLNTADWVFDQWVERFESASTEGAHDDVVDDLHDWRYSLEDAMDDGFGNTPYELTEVSLNRLIMDRYDDHPRADEIDVPELWFPVLQSVSRDEFVSDGRVDGGRGLLEQIRGSPPDFVEQFDRYQTTNGTKLAFDWRHPHLSRRAVRRAILEALPIDQIVDIGRFGDPKPVQTGLSEPAERRWLGEDRLGGFRRHSIEADDERAGELMRAAGYSRDGSDRWRGPDGDRVSLRVRSPMWDNWKSSGDLVASALREFGFEIDFFQISNTRLVTDVRTHNFDVMLWYSDARPYQVYDVSSTSSATIGYGTTDPDAETSEQGKPIEVSVPTENGTETVNLVEEWHRLRGASDAATTTDAITTFARWWNEALPDVQLATQVSGVWGNTRDFDWPDDDGTTYRAAGPGDRPEYRLLNHGLVGSAEK